MANDAAAGPSALRALHSDAAAGEPFRLVLTDAHMPEMDGFTVVQELKKHPGAERPTVMVLSSAGHRGDAARWRTGCGSLPVKACAATRTAGRDCALHLHVPEAVLLAIAHPFVRTCGAMLSVTMSLGALAVAPGAVCDVDEALRRADELLYAVKNGGLNCVVSGIAGRSGNEQAAGIRSPRLTRSHAVTMDRPVPCAGTTRGLEHLRKHSLAVKGRDDASEHLTLCDE